MHLKELKQELLIILLDMGHALDNSINACTDSDGDDVGDVFDLDDDNDGVLDTTERTGDTDKRNTKPFRYRLRW